METLSVIDSVYCASALLKNGRGFGQETTGQSIWSVLDGQNNQREMAEHQKYFLSVENGPNPDYGYLVRMPYTPRIGGLRPFQTVAQWGGTHARRASKSI